MCAWHVADKATDIERLDELLSSTEHEKMAALAMHDEMQVLLDRERQDKVNIIRANTEQARHVVRWCVGGAGGWQTAAGGSCCLDDAIIIAIEREKVRNRS